MTLMPFGSIVVRMSRSPAVACSTAFSPGTVSVVNVFAGNCSPDNNLVGPDSFVPPRRCRRLQDGSRAKLGSMPQALVGMELSELRGVLPPDQPGYRAAQLYRAIYREKVAELVQISTLPSSIRSELAAHSELGLPQLDRRFESSDGTRRYLLRLTDGKTVETVMMPEGDRDTVCISSQVGCPVDCKFCMTALMGLERSLTAGEIVGQVLFVARDNNLLVDNKRFNIVMMGMGEPLLNL